MTPYVLGEEEVVAGFALIGVAGTVPTSPEDALRDFRAASEHQGSVLLLITESVADWMRPEIRDAMLAGTIVQVIAGTRPTRGRGMDSRALLLSALGIKL
ncbi:MAG TPA: V-type ATP synthase subunit F [Xanthobacteraceae bacterium]|nr:V-type ATP synthase subunit F [Xanthobacteraceae bacterium]